MKKILSVGMITLLMLSTMYIVSERAKGDCNPDITLPPDYVTMIANHGTVNYFDIELSNVPPGYDVTNGVYPGWCNGR